MRCPHCEATVARAGIEVLTSLPRTMHLPACPTCHAEALLWRADGGMECASCGMVFEVDGSAKPQGVSDRAEDPVRTGEAPGGAEKKRNYTPDRGMKSLLPVVGLPALAPRSQGTVLPPPHRPDPETGAAPAAREDDAIAAAGPPAPGHSVQPVRVPPFSTRDSEVLSHVMAEQRRRRGRGIVLLAAVIVVGGAVAYLVPLLRKGSGPSTMEALPGNSINLPEAAARPAPPPKKATDVLGARRFMAEKVAKAEKWEDLLPLIRCRSEVEPLMRAYYASHPF